MKKTLFFSILAMLITFAAKAQTQTYTYIDEDGNSKNATSVTEIVGNITSPLSDGWYYVSSASSMTGDLEISGDVKLILDKDLTIDGKIEIPSGSSLTIYGTSNLLYKQATLYVDDDINAAGTLIINSCLKVDTHDIGSSAATISILGGQVSAEAISAANLTLGYKSMDDKIVCSSITANAITIAEGCSYQLDGNTYSGELSTEQITNFCEYVADHPYVVAIGKTSEVFEEGIFSYTILDDGKSVQVSGLVEGATAPENLTIPSSVEHGGTTYVVKYIGGYAFSYPSKVSSNTKNVTIPGTIVEIKEYAFANCGMLETVEVEGNGLKFIGDYAFYYIPLKEITLPASIEYIGASAFENCINESLTVYCNAVNAPELGENALNATYSVNNYNCYLYIPPCADYSNSGWQDFFGSNIYVYVPFDQTGFVGTYDKEFDGSVDVPNFIPVTLTPADGVTLTFTKLEFADPNVEVDYNGNPVAKSIMAFYNLKYSANESCNTTGNEIRLKEVSATITPHEITQDEIESVIKSRRTPITDDYYAYAKAGHYEGSNNGKLDGRYTTTVVLYPNDPIKTVKFRLNAYYVIDESLTTIVASANDAKYIHIEETSGFWDAEGEGTHNYAFANSYENFSGAIGNFQPYVERSADELTFKYDILPTDANITYYTFPNADNKVPDWDEAGNKTNITKVVFDPYFKDAAPTSCLDWFNGFEILATIQDIQYLNTADVTRMDGMFASCNALQAVDVSHFDTKRVVNMNDMFASCGLLETIDVSHFNTENVTNMASMFSGCKKVKLLDVSGFDTRKVTTMYRMFNECSILETLDVSHFNTYNVTTMSSMFYNCPNLNPLDVSGFDTHNVTDMTFMFNNCNQSNLDVSHFDTKKVTKMGSMFCDYKGTTLDLSSFNTESVVDMSYMFANSKNLTSLDVSSFNTSNVTNMRAMFGYTYADNQLVTEGNNLTSINFGDNFNTQKVTDMAYMFFGCKKLESLDLGNQFYTSAVIDMSYMFDQCSSLTSLDLSKFNTENVTKMQRMFYNCTSLKKIYVTEGQWSNENAPSSSKTFSGDTQLIGEKGTKYDASYTTSEYARIDGGPESSTPGYLTAAKEAYAVYADGTLTFKCGDKTSESSSYVYDLPTTITKVDDVQWLEWKNYITKVVFDESFDFARPVTCAYWFSGCTKLTEITGMEYLHTDKVTDMSYMFNNCESLELVDVSQFNTANVTTMQRMFGGCYKMRMLNLTSFNTAKVTEMEGMFSMYINSWPKTNLTAIYVGAGWDVTKVTSSNNMFDDCAALIGGKGTTYDEHNVGISRAKVDGGTSDPGYLTDISNHGYAELKDGTLTFKQGMMPAKTDGVEYFELTSYTQNGLIQTGENVLPGWCSKRKDITKVVFEPEFYNVIVRDCGYWFYECTKLNSINNLTNLNTSEVTTMKFMFADCSQLASIDLSNFHTNNVYNFSSMFSGCTALTKLDDIANITFNTTKYKNTGTGSVGDERIKVDGMFAHSGLKKIDVSHWATTPIGSYRSLFLHCDQLTDVNVTGIVKAYTVDPETGNDVVATTDLYNMFFGCSSLGTDLDHPLDVSSFETDNVTNMAYMFDGCSGLPSIDVSNFKTSKVKDISYMFSGCSGLTVLDISNFNTSAVTDMDWMFANCSNLTTIKIKIGTNPEDNGWNMSKVSESNTKCMFKNDYSLIGNDGTLCDVSVYSDDYYIDGKFAHANEGGYLTTDDYKIFYDIDADDDEYKLTSADQLSIKTGTAHTTYEGGAVVKLPTLKDRATDDPFLYWQRTTQNASGNIVNTGKIEEIGNKEKGNRIYSAKWTLAKEKYAVYNDGSNTLKFYFDADKDEKTGAYSLNEDATTPGWVTDHSADIQYVEFDESITELKPTSCYQWFMGCSNLKALDLRKLNTKNTTNMVSMFNGCSSLTGILISDNWNTGKVSNEDSKDMFKGCTSLIGENGDWVDPENKLDKTFAVANFADSYYGYLTQDNFKIFYHLNDFDENGDDGDAQFSDGDDYDDRTENCSDAEETTLETPTWEGHIFSGWSKVTGYDFDEYEYLYDTEEPLHQNSVSPGSGNMVLFGLWDKNYPITLPGDDWELTDEFGRELPKDSNDKPTAPKGAKIIIEYKGTKVVKEVQVETN